MKMLCAALLSLVCIGAVQAQQAVVTITVKQQSQQEPNGTPFKNVGPFEVYRAQAKFADGSCPDFSNDRGKLSCVIKCNKDDKMEANLAIRPPTKGNRITGYVPPPAENIQVVGCVVRPQEREFVYVDGRMVLQAIYRNEASLAKLMAADPKGTFTIESSSKSLETYRTLVKTPEGLDKLRRIQQAAATASDGQNARGDAFSASAFSEISIGASNLLIAEVVKKYAPAQMKAIKVTGDSRDYFGNLTVLQGALEEKVGRTTDQNLLLNDLDTLKQSPRGGFTAVPTLTPYAIKR